MSMTLEEAIDVVESFRNVVARMENTEYTVEALDMAISALRPVSRERVEKVFPGCPYCDMAKANDNIYNKALWVKEAETSKWTLAGKSLQYCPICGRPLTDEAVDMVMERIVERLYRRH